MSRDAVDVATDGLEGELARAERALAAAAKHHQQCTERVERLRDLLERVRLAVHQDGPARTVPAHAAAPYYPSQILALGTKGGLGAIPVAEGQTVRQRIRDALRLHDRPEGLEPLQVAALIRIDKSHVGVELCHLYKQGTVSRVAPGRYRAPQEVTHASAQAL